MKRIVLCAFVFLAALTGDLGARGGRGASYDAFYLNPQNSNVATASKSLRASQTLNPAVRNLVIIAPGQSNIGSYAPSAYSPANPNALDNLNVFDGAVYAAADPMLGAAQGSATIIGNPILRLADALVTNNKFDRVVIVPIAVDSTTVQDWQTGYVSNKIAVALGRLAYRGMVAGTNITVVILWGQGESNTTAGTSQGTYAASLAAVISASRTAGFTGKWFVAKETWNGTTVSTAIQNAQTGIVDHGADIWAGPDADALVSTACGGVACRGGDAIHWSDVGSAYYAGSSGSGGWYQALTASGAPF